MASSVVLNSATRRSSDIPSAPARAATVKNAGVGTRPDSIFRSASRLTLDVADTAARVVADMLAAVRAAAAPGTRLAELDAVARGVLAAAGATSPFLGYAPLPTTRPFPGVVCLSVNDVALHGIPTARVLEDGDLLSVDAGATLDGWVGDSATTFPVGAPRPEDLRFLAGGSDDYVVDADGWTLRSADGSRAAHVEHTVAITEDGPRILTAPR